MSPTERIIVALDVNSREEALALVNQLQGRVGFFKVGSQLFTAEGPQVVRDIVRTGERVFLDLKFHDIPNTVVKAALVAQSLGVSMMTVHASGGLKMMSMVTGALKTFVTQAKRPLVLGVTVLTSLSSEALREVGYESPIQDHVIRLAKLAQQAGLDGIVTSPSEVPVVRQRLGNSLKIVTPGIRPIGGDRDDQSRIATPVAAIKAGADYLVIGRPITASKDPLSSLERILQMMRDEGL